MLASPEPTPSPSAGAAIARRFREIYLRELDFVWTVLLRLGVDESHVEDAAHDVFVVVHRQLERFEGRSSERTWIYAIARRVAWRHRRSEHRRARRHAVLATVSPAPTDLDDQLRSREARDLLAAFLDTLDRPKRDAFVLGELEALSRASLGRALGVSPGTAYSRLRAARAAFTAAFGPDGPHRALVSSHASAREPVPRDARHRLWLVLPGGLGPASGAAGTSGAVAFAATLVVGVGLLGALAAGWPALAGRRDLAGDAAVSRAGTRGIERSEHPSDAAGPLDAAAQGERPAAEPSIPARERSGLEPPPMVQRAPRPSIEAPLARASRAEGRSASRVAEPPAASPSPEPLAEAVVTSAPPEVIVDALAEEASLMAEARAAMRAEQWDRARVLLGRHAERFPAGLLASERRISAVVVAARELRR